MAVFDPDAQGGDFEEIRFIQHPSGLRAITAVHSTTRGPAFGGIRRRDYASEADALEDARRLAEGMSLKLALADLPAGGAKTVILAAPGDTAEQYRALGRAIDQMHGRYVCGPDVGTGAGELDYVRESTPHVNPTGNDANASTAAGVMAGIRGTIGVLGSPLAEATFAVQGLGGVGLAVAEMLIQAGARVLGTDVTEGACDAARNIGVEIVAPEAILDTPCDVFVPCALGGILTPESGALVAARAICGSANNQLSTPEVDAILHARGVLWAPDFAVNVGAVAEGVITMQQGATPESRAEAYRIIDRVEHTVAAILERAHVEDTPPGAIANAMARERLAA